MINRTELRHLLIIFLFICNYSYGISDKPNLLRACINFDDSTITLNWNKATDACGSFAKLIIYGNQNNGPFLEIFTLTDINIVEYPHYIPNLNTVRSYYIVLKNACNGIDSFVSDTITPDLSYPANSEIDSLSYDVNSQDIIAGWQQSSSSDTKGYQIYNFATGNGDSIGFTNDTKHTISKSIASVFPVVIATLDSCNLSSTLSKPHQVMFLKGSIDTCANSINLNWSTYQGWDAIDSQVVLVRFKNQLFKKEALLTGTDKSFVFNNFTLGDTFDIIVRAYTKAGTISSSSNLISFATRKLNTPTVFYLSNVTVTDLENITLNVYMDDYQDQNSIVVYKSTSGNQLQRLKAFNTSSINNYSYNDFDVVVNEHSYNYQLKLVNKCLDTIQTSNLSRSILLKLTPQLDYNSYVNWLGGVKEYNLQFSKDGSTWNSINTSSDTTMFYDSLEPGCFRIQALENTNTLSINQISYSNTVCKIDSMRIFVPTGINLTTQNNQFIVLGTGINHQESTYIIYNRWGEQLVNNPTDSTWNMNYGGELVEQGVYIYIVNAIGLLGEKQTLKGTIYVIR